MSLKEIKNNAGKIKADLIKSIESQQKKLQSLTVKNAKSCTKAMGDLGKAKKGLQAAKTADAKKKGAALIKAIETQHKEFVAVSALLKGAEQYLKGAMKSARAAIKVKAVGKKVAKKKPAVAKAA